MPKISGISDNSIIECQNLSNKNNAIFSSSLKEVNTTNNKIQTIEKVDNQNDNQILNNNISNNKTKTNIRVISNDYYKGNFQFFIIVIRLVTKTLQDIDHSPNKKKNLIVRTTESPNELAPIISSSNTNQMSDFLLSNKLQNGVGTTTNLVKKQIPISFLNRNHHYTRANNIVNKLNTTVNDSDNITKTNISLINNNAVNQSDIQESNGANKSLYSRTHKTQSTNLNFLYNKAQDSKSKVYKYI